MAEIPPDDWAVITAGVTDPAEQARLRFAYTAGAYRGKWLVLDAIGQLTMPDAAPIAVLVPDEMVPVEQALEME